LVESPPAAHLAAAPGSFAGIDASSASDVFCRVNTRGTDIAPVVTVTYRRLLELLDYSQLLGDCSSTRSTPIVYATTLPFAMAPSTKAIETALVDGTVDVFRAEPDETTVNKVRRHVEDKLELGENFLSSAKWKQKSKELIKTTVVSTPRIRGANCIMLTGVVGKAGRRLGARGESRE
jgi:hypothetical protein